MNRRSGPIVLILSATALLATGHLLRSTTADRRPSKSNGDQSEVVADIDALIDVIWAETGLPRTERFSTSATHSPTVPPTVASAAEISDADKSEILNCVIADVLQSPDFQHKRDFYGTPGKQSAVIEMGSDVKLPRDFKANVSGWDIESRNAVDEPDPDSPRIVAIRLDKFAPHKPAQLFWDGHVAVCIFNGGGNPDGVFHMGGLSVYYRVKKSNGKWTADCVFAIDP